MEIDLYTGEGYHPGEKILDIIAWHYFTPPVHRQKLTIAKRAEGYIALTHARKCSLCRTEYDGLKEMYAGIIGTSLGNDAFNDFLAERAGEQ